MFKTATMLSCMFPSRSIQFPYPAFDINQCHFITITESLFYVIDNMLTSALTSQVYDIRLVYIFVVEHCVLDGLVVKELKMDLKHTPSVYHYMSFLDVYRYMSHFTFTVFGSMWDPHF